jgi:sialate O-acetylesterase
MANTLKLANTGMAITTDVGEANDIHPKDKQNVGKRLAMWALAKAYNQEKIASSGPLFSSHEVKGKEVIIRFTNTNGGLKSSGPELKGFAIAGADKKWKFANARIEGETVIVSSPDINAPLMVRFAWADNPIATLFNGAGIPAAPFRTDK